MVKTIAYKLLTIIVGLGLGAWLIIFGIGAFAIPLIGLPLGFILIFLGFMSGVVGIAHGLAVTPANYKRSTYKCPRCDNWITVMAYQKALNCKICKRRLLLTDKGFELA